MKKFVCFIISLSMLLSVVFVPSVNAYAATEVKCNTNYTVTISSSGGSAVGSFTPIASGSYTIYSTGNIDTYAELWDSSESTRLSYDDDSGQSRNFSITYYFTANVNYHIKFKCYGSGTGQFTVRIDDGFTSLTSNSGSTLISVSKSNEKHYYSFTPSAAGVYRFYSDCSYNTKVWLYDAKFTQIDTDDNSGRSSNYALSYYLSANTKYIIGSGFSGTTTGSYTMYYEKLNPESLDVTDSKSSYYVGDSVNKNTLTVTAIYPSYYEDSFSRNLQSWAYDVDFDTSIAGSSIPLRVTLINSTVSASIPVTVVKPEIYVSGGGYDYYNIDDSYLLSSIENTATATTNPSNVQVYWESADSSILQVSSIDKKSAQIYVLNPSEEPVAITAYYTYNGIKYSCTFMAEIPFEVQNATLYNKKTSYIYGESFVREKVRATIVNSTGSKTGTFSVSGDLPTTKKAPGTYKRTAVFYGNMFSYNYTVKCATPKISSVKPVSSTSQKVTWSKAGGAKGYYVYRATSKTGTYKKIATTTSTSITSSKLSANKTYYYKVKAYYNTNSAYNSAYSAVASGKTKLSTPSSVKAKAGTKKVTVSWKKVSGAKGYYVYRATSKNGKYTKVATTSKTSYTNSKLKSKKTYYYKVVAYSSNSSYNSAYSKVVSAKTK